MVLCEHRRLSEICLVYYTMVIFSEGQTSTGSQEQFLFNQVQGQCEWILHDPRHLSEVKVKVTCENKVSLQTVKQTPSRLINMIAPNLTEVIHRVNSLLWLRLIKLITTTSTTWKKTPRPTTDMAL